MGVRLFYVSSLSDEDVSKPMLFPNNLYTNPTPRAMRNETMTRHTKKATPKKSISMKARSGPTSV